MHRLVYLACVVVALAGCDGWKSAAKLTASAQTLFDKRDYSGAIVELKNALNKKPDLPEARLLLGKALLQNGDPRGALIELAKAQELLVPDDQAVPEVARALLAVGQGARVIAEFGPLSLRDPGAMADLKSSVAAAHAAQGETDAARTVAQAALQVQAGFGPAVIVLARLDAGAGDTAAAMRQLDELLAREPGNPAAGLLKSDILLHAASQPDAAVAALRQVLAAQPQSIDAHVALLDTLLQQNKVAEAKAQFKLLQQAAPKHPDTLFVQAQIAFADNDFKGSRETTERLLAKLPDHPRLLLLAGAAEYRMRQYTQAEALLARAVKAAPTLPMARLMLAQTFLRAAKPDKAIEALQPIIDSTSADATSLTLAGEAYLQRGDNARSDAAFQRALKLGADTSPVRMSMALAQLGRGESARAVSQLEAIAQGDSGTRADLALVMARWRANDLDGALRAIDALEKKLPADPLPLALRGRLLAQRGDVAGATAALEAALAKAPNHYPAVSDLAAFDFNAGQPDKARKRFQALIKVAPRDYRPHLALAELDARLGAAESVVVGQLRQAAQIDPSAPVPHLTLVERLLASGAANDALVAAQNASAALPNNLAVMDALGRAQSAVGDHQSAISTFNRLASLQPKSAAPQVRLADAHMAAKNPAAAAKALRQALEIEPGNLLGQRGLALLALAEKRPQEGVAIARSIQQRLPAEAAGFVLEGEIEAGSRNWAAAAAAYATALQKAPSTDLATRLHRCLREGGKGAEADRMAASWQKSNPKDAAFIYYLGNVASEAKDWAQAEAKYRAVVALQPRNAVALNNIAWLLASQRKPGATALAEQANALMPERASLIDTLALAQEADGKVADAVKTQKRAVDLDPRDPMLRLRLARLLVKNGDKSAARDQLDILTRLGTGFSGQAEVGALMKTL